MLEVLYPPISAMTDSGETGYSLGSHPQCTLNTVSFFFFLLYLLQFSETSFENLNCGFQKDCKITVLNLKNKIFIFNLKVKLEGRLKAVIFQTEKENPQVTPSHNRSRSPALLSFSSTTSSPSSQGLPWAGRRRGSRHTGSSVPRLRGLLAPPSSQIQVALKEHGQAGDSDPKHNRGY